MSGLLVKLFHLKRQREGLIQPSGALIIRITEDKTMNMKEIRSDCKLVSNAGAISWRTEDYYTAMLIMDLSFKLLFLRKKEQTLAVCSFSVEIIRCLKICNINNSCLSLSEKNDCFNCNVLFGNIRGQERSFDSCGPDWCRRRCCHLTCCVCLQWCHHCVV